MKIRIIKASDNDRKTVTFHMELKGIFGWSRIKRSIGPKKYELPFKTYEECETEMYKEFFRCNGIVIQNGNVYSYKQYDYFL